ncbi:MAG: ABC transporter permease [Gemmatimonadota bacterium]|nr:MAG: ABC transporter permease [Gemmatimonadota bacterium]
MTQPPRLAVLLLRLALDARDRRFVLDDLSEEYAARVAAGGQAPATRWYWSQVTRSLGPVLWRRACRPRRLVISFQPRGTALESLWQDLRFAVRTLWRIPGFTLTAVATVALGIGVNTAAFSLVSSVVLKPLPFEDADRLVEIWAEGEPMGAQVTTTPQPEMLQAWLDRAESFDAIGLFNEEELTHSGGAEPEILHAAIVSPNLMEMLRVTPRLGRELAPADVESGEGQGVLLSEGFWRRRFGSDPEVLGRTLTLDEKSYVVVGIAPLELERLFEARFFIGPPKQVWLPLSVASIQTWEDTPFVIARLKPHVAVAEAQAELDVIQASLTAAGLNEGGWRPLVSSTAEMVNSRLATVLWVLLGSVGLVLLIGCANIANMLMARGVTRRHEFAVRSALGASRARVTRQLLVEGLVLSVVGAGLGVVLTYWTLEATAGLAAHDIRELRSVRIDPIVLVFTLGLSLVTALIFALAPAAQLQFCGTADSLTGGARTGTSSTYGSLVRQSLVAAEVAMALVLLVGAGLLLNSFMHLSRVDPGFHPSGVVALELTLPETRYPETVQRREFFRTVADRIRLLPAAQVVGLARGVPPDVPWLFGTVEIDGREDVVDTSPLKAGNWISPEYFGTIGASLREGREFTAIDSRSDAAPVIVNESLARRFWPDGGAVGTRIRLELPFQSEGVVEHTVVGVLRDIKAFGLGDEPDRMQVYFPFDSYSAREGVVVVRAAGDTDDLIPQLKEQVWAVDPNLPITRVIRLDRDLSANIARPRFNALLLSSFAALALLLAVIGVYGVTSLSASQRTREIGVRVALGAQRSDILKLMVGSGMKPIAIGAVLGLALSYAFTRFLRSLLFEIEPTDVLTFVTVTLVLVVVGVLACYVPSRRVTAVDPIGVLRQE